MATKTPDPIHPDVLAHVLQAFRLIVYELRRLIPTAASDELELKVLEHVREAEKAAQS